MEKPDRDALENPKEYILDRGGAILIVTLAGKPVGVCALIKRDDRRYPYELAKMAVSPKVRGKGVGSFLGQAVIGKARELGAPRLFLESNTKLKLAMALYQKLGFRRIQGPPTPYARCNIQMELELQR
jgi:GNAT superfamily N-acetyltransferase